MIKMVAAVIAILFVLQVGCTYRAEPDLGRIAYIRLYMRPEDLQKLNESTTSDEYAPCVYDNGFMRIDAQIKVRGALSRRYWKKSYTVRFDALGETVQYAFDGSFKDPSHIRNRLAMNAYREVGLPAPVTEGVALFINDVYMGYYTRLEMYRESVLNAHYGESCELFKARFVELGYDVPLRGDSEKKFPDDHNYSSLELLIANARNMDDESWNSWVSAKADIEEIARYLVVHDFLSVGDTEVKNFYILNYGKFLILPWDNEHSMRRTWAGSLFESAEYSLGGDNILTRRLLSQGSPVRDRYNDLYRELFIEDDGLTQTLMEMVSAFYEEIDRAVYHEPLQHWEYEDFLQEKEVLLSFFDERRDEIGNSPLP
jgi:spore coat protein H